MSHMKQNSLEITDRAVQARKTKVIVEIALEKLIR